MVVHCHAIGPGVAFILVVVKVKGTNIVNCVTTTSLKIHETEIRWMYTYMYMCMYM